MTTLKSRIFAALALTTAMTAPALIVPMFTAPAAIAGEATHDFADLAAKVTPAVVNVAVTMKADPEEGGATHMSDRSAQSQMEEFMQRFMEQNGRGHQMKPQHPGGQKTQAVGTGFIIDASGIIVTNNHVAGKADSITVTLSDGRKLPAKLLGADEKTDLAVLKVESDKPLPYVSFGDATKLRVGQSVMAVGNPFGLGGTVTTGIVSARGRDIQQGPFDDYIQTDAAINRGNSGGPLFDMDGKVIGINTAIYSPSGGSIGLGFAIPSSQAEPVVAQLKTSGKVERGLLGVQIQPVTQEIADSMSLSSASGALVASVVADSPALKAGIKSGDVVRSVDGKDIESARELTRMISAVKPGETVKIGLWRDGKDMTVTAKLGDQSKSDVVKTNGEAPEAKGPGSYGVSLAPLSRDARQELGLDGTVEGVLVAQVEPGSPAETQGLQAGDVIQQVGRDAVDSPAKVATKLGEAKKTGKPVLLKVYRDGMTRFVAISPRAT
jgi:serine protease Do